MNAKEEFISCFNRVDVICAEIYVDCTSHSNEDGIVEAILKVNYTLEDYAKFLAKLDLEYNAGYGSQELLGTVWQSNNRWSTKWKYDGSQPPERHVMPEIPTKLV